MTATSRVFVSSTFSEHSTRNECPSDEELRSTLLGISMVAHTPEEFERALQEEAPHAASCALCSRRLFVISMEEWDAMRDECILFQDPPSQQIDRILSSSPRCWPPSVNFPHTARWPELEAVGESFLRDQYEQASARFATICKALDDAEGGRERRRYLQEYVRKRLTPAEEAVRELTAPTKPSRSLARVATRLAASIDQAVLKLKNLEWEATRLCEETDQLGYAFSGVSLVRFEEGTIEAVAGTGAAAAWVSQVRHPIETHVDRDLQDIQSYVVLSVRGELVRPLDPRLDAWVNHWFQHVIPRYFVPLIVATDARGRIINDQCHWVAVPGATHPEIQLVTPKDAVVRVFGTIEVGLDVPENSRETSEETEAAHLVDRLIELADFVTERAPRVYRCTVARVFDTVVAVFRRLACADSATLHLGKLRLDHAGVEDVDWHTDYCFRNDPAKGPHLLSTHNFDPGTIGGTPRPQGMGSEAIRTRQWRFQAGNDLRESNPPMFALGVRSMTAFPIFAGSDVGVIYTHRRTVRRPDQEEIFWQKYLAGRAARGIECATTYARERDRRMQVVGQLKAARIFFEAMHDTPPAMQWVVTGSLLNLTAADLVFLYRVNPAQLQITEPQLVGKSLTRGTPDWPKLFPFVEQAAQSGKSVFVPKRFLWEHGARTFAEIERLNYLVALPLMHAGDWATVLVLGYRRNIEIEPAEQKHLELLASTAKVALEMNVAVHLGAITIDAAKTLGKALRAVSANDFVPRPEGSVPKFEKASRGFAGF